MQETSLQALLDRDALVAFAAGRGEPSWLAKAREEALSAFLAASMPDRAQHLWRYSDPALFEPARVEFGSSPAPDAGAAADSDWSTGIPGVRLFLSEEARAKGVSILPLSKAAEDPGHGAQIRKYLGKAVGKDFGRLEALDAAAWTRGVYLHIPRGVHLDEALRIEFADASAGLFDGRRVLAVIEDEAQVTLVEQHAQPRGEGQDRQAGAGTSQGTSTKVIQHAGGSTSASQGSKQSASRSYGVSEVFVGSGASVNYVLLQTVGEKMNAHLTQRVVLQRDARARISLLSFGGKAVKIDTGTLLRGEGSEVETAGLLYGRGRQFFDHHTDHHHSAPHTISNLDFKVVLSGRSHSAYTGNITIEKKAPFSSALQENRNLLLSVKISKIQCGMNSVRVWRRSENAKLCSSGIRG